jgi:hypothetical protein
MIMFFEACANDLLPILCSYLALAAICHGKSAKLSCAFPILEKRVASYLQTAYLQSPKPTSSLLHLTTTLLSPCDSHQQSRTTLSSSSFALYSTVTCFIDESHLFCHTPTLTVKISTAQLPQPSFCLVSTINYPSTFRSAEMSQRITRSVTASRRRARLHLLALPGEVRSLIIKELCSSAMCFLGMHGLLEYSGVCLSLLETCSTLRRETLFVLARSMQFELWNLRICMPCVHRSLLPGIWDHLREITYVETPPALDQLECLKQIKSLEYVHWKPIENEPWGCPPGEEMSVSTAIEHQAWNVDLGRWVATVPDRHWLSPGLDDRSLSVSYMYLDVPFKVQVHFQMHAEVAHPISSRLGYLDLVSHRVRVTSAR